MNNSGGVGMNGYGNMAGATSYNPYQQQAGTVPQYMMVMPQPTTAVPQYMANMPQYVTTMPQQMARMPQQMARMPQQMASMPQQTASMPQQMASMPQQVGVMPQQATTTPQQMASMQQARPATPQTSPAGAGKTTVKYDRVSLINKGCDCHRNNGLDADCRCQPKRRTAMTLPSQPKQEEAPHTPHQFRRFERGMTPPTPRYKPVQRRPVTLGGTDARSQQNAGHQQARAEEYARQVAGQQQQHVNPPQSGYNGLDNSMKPRSDSPIRADVNKTVPAAQPRRVAADVPNRRRDSTLPPWALHTDEAYDSHPTKKSATTQPGQHPTQAAMNQHQQATSQQHNTSETKTPETMRQEQPPKEEYQAQAQSQQTQQAQQQQQQYAPQQQAQQRYACHPGCIHNHPAYAGQTNKPLEPHEAYRQHQAFLQQYQRQPTAYQQRASLVEPYQNYVGVQQRVYQQPHQQAYAAQRPVTPQQPSPEQVAAFQAQAQQQQASAQQSVAQADAGQAPAQQQNTQQASQTQQQTPEAGPSQAAQQHGHPQQGYLAPQQAHQADSTQAYAQPQAYQQHQQAAYPYPQQTPQAYSPQAYAQQQAYVQQQQHQQQAYGTQQQQNAQAPQYQTQAQQQAYAQPHPKPVAQPPVPAAYQIHRPEEKVNSVNQLVEQLNKKCAEEEVAIAQYFQQREASKQPNPDEANYQQTQQQTRLAQEVIEQEHVMAQQQELAIQNDQQARGMQQGDQRQQYMQHQQAAEPYPNQQVAQQYQGHGYVQQQHGAGEHPAAVQTQQETFEQPKGGQGELGGQLGGQPMTPVA